jgi:hypothetical protein
MTNGSGKKKEWWTKHCSILDKKDGLVWWTPEEWSILSEDSNRRDLLKKLKE